VIPSLLPFKATFCHALFLSFPTRRMRPHRGRERMLKYAQGKYVEKVIEFTEPAQERARLIHGSMKENGQGQQKAAVCMPKQRTKEQKAARCGVLGGAAVQRVAGWSEGILLRLSSCVRVSQAAAPVSAACVRMAEQETRRKCLEKRQRRLEKGRSNRHARGCRSRKWYASRQRKSKEFYRHSTEQALQ